MSSLVFRYILIVFRHVFSLRASFARWRDPTLSPEPTLKHFYVPSHPNSLPTHIYLPASLAGAPLVKRPLLINIHGGGFFMGFPEMDSKICVRLASLADCVVASINYRKAPENPFPAGLDDCETTILALLNDPRLAPVIDPTRIALMGSSAGGALALSASLNPELQRRNIVKGVVAVASITDCTLSQRARMDSLPPESDGKDILKDINLVIDAYMSPTGDGLRIDPRASPIFADPALFPKLKIISPRRDCLYGEQKRFVQKLRESRGGDGGVEWTVLEDLDHASRDARSGAAVEKWEAVWEDTAVFLTGVWSS